ALSLPSELQARKSQSEGLREEITSVRKHIVELVEEINGIHPRLESTLLDAIQRFPPNIQTERTLRAEVLANTIETCLLKLSLMRYRTYAALYGFSSTSSSTSPPTPNTPTSATMHAALTQTHTLLRTKDLAQQDEEKRLDKQLREYEKVMELVGRGRGGGFGQVVEDMARVKREMDECRRDLKRLGWTGD
ncbi:hypothetical protein BXZ70DRAFT_897331, partial [Cristinia sonorae]